MDSTLTPPCVFVVMGVTVRTCPRKTKGAFSANVRTSAMEGGSIRRHQAWTASKNNAKLAETMLSQTRSVCDFHMAPDGLGRPPKVTPLRLSDSLLQVPDSSASVS